MAPRLLVLAPDPSGDRLAGPLVAAWRRLSGGSATALGGGCLAAAGAEVAWDQEPFATLGFADAIRSLPRTIPPARRALSAVDDHDGLLVTDARWLLERAAPRARAKGIPVVWLAPSPDWRVQGPSARTRRLGDLADLLLLTDPLARLAYPERSLWMGHPGLEAAAGPTCEREDLIGVFPGSRRGEIARLMRPFLGAARLAGLPGRIVVSDPFGLVGPLPAGAQADRGPAGELLARCRVALAASGTVVQEAVVAGTPVVAAYKGASILWSWIGLTGGGPPFWVHPNLLAGKEVVPEFIQGAATAESLAAALRGLWRDPGRADALEALASVRPSYLGGAGLEAGAAAMARLVPG